MEFYLDSADCEKIRRYVEPYNLRGVTCNPLLYARDRAACRPLLEAVPADKLLFMQTIADDVDTIVAEARRLASLRKRMVVKIPATADGLQAIRRLGGEKIETLATGVYSTAQACLAANCGAAYVAPYVNRMCDLELDGVKIALEIQQAFRRQALPCKVLAASFKNLLQVKQLLADGIDAVTLPADLFEALLRHPPTAQATREFAACWQRYTGGGALGL